MTDNHSYEVLKWTAVCMSSFVYNMSCVHYFTAQILSH